MELQPGDAERLVDLFDQGFVVDVDRVRTAIARRGMFNLIHTAAVVKLGVIVRKDGAYREEEFRRRRRATVDGATMWVVAAFEDLVLSKLDWARESRSEVQLRDVRHVIAGQPALDWPYVTQWATALPIVHIRALPTSTESLFLGAAPSRVTQRQSLMIFALGKEARRQ